MVGDHAADGRAGQGMMSSEVTHHAANNGALEAPGLGDARRQAQPQDRDHQRFHIDFLIYYAEPRSA
jgi:hypothetical protein